MLAKKSLGQNFLNNKTIIKKIVETGQVNSDDTVLEIGPGQGTLTAELLATGATVIAVEKDDRLIPFLSEMFAAEIKKGKFTLIHGDILEISLETLKLKDKKYKLIANIPYYITGFIIRMFLETLIQPSRIVLLVQKEVADRITARDKKESILSISVKVYGEPHNAGLVKAGNFTPKPNVDSSILAIRHITKDFFTKNAINEKEFFEIVRAGFLGKRKMLINTLSTLVPKEEVAKLFEQIRLSPKVRAEDITITDWAHIVSGLNIKK